VGQRSSSSSRRVRIICRERDKVGRVGEASELLEIRDELVGLFRRATSAGFPVPYAERQLLWLDTQANWLMNASMNASMYEPVGTNESGDDEDDDDNTESAATDDDAEDVAAEHLHFEILPPGKRSVEGVIEHYQRQARQYAQWIGPERKIDPGRLLAMRSLGPLDCYIGKKMWLGYVVFTFAETSKVVLECPLEGNATYVLDGDWKRLVGKSKKDLRRRHARSVTKIVHKGDWVDRIAASLGRPAEDTADSIYGVPR